MNVDNVKNNGELKSDNSEDLNEKIIAVINVRNHTTYIILFVKTF